ncbi:MAG: UvrD-helicase domain-containing protein [Flavobacteriales bacterium]|jgi:ATP-dependent exoDNAse (exonuclease V) beta subunit|nr:UvrD-helicase domain-containing protein [Flavobacteriales bacterium]
MGRIIIHDASAGSGKTYTLVKNYLKICLSPDQPITVYQKILAITFTNKAAKEMQDRIVETLGDFLSQGTENTLFVEFAQYFGYSKEQLHQRCFQLQQSILHNYSNFAVSTIDKFMLKIIRSIRFEVGLKSSFEILADYQEWFDYSINELIEQINENKGFDEYIQQFISELLQDGKSWNLKYQLGEIAGNLVREEYRKKYQYLFDIQSFDELKSIRKNLDKEQKEIEAALDTIQSGFVEVLRTNEVAWTDFQRNAKCVKVILGTPGDWKKKIAEGAFKTFLKRLEDKVFFSKKNLAIFEQAQGQMASFFDEYAENIRRLLLHLIHLQKLISQLRNIELEYLLLKYMEDYLSQESLLPLSYLNTILENFVKTSDIPMMLLKMGEYYEYVFIDEFQDTSNAQWDNLFPLLENILSKGYQVELIGDAKQSIYRFRGGDVGILLGLKKERNQGAFQVEDAPLLDTNWRSDEVIVDFNNQLFAKMVSQEFPQESWKEIYQQAEQKIHYKNRQGFVEITHASVETEEINETNAQKILSIIEDNLSRGFSYGDISILFRKNKDIQAISELLLAQEIPFVDSESLLVFSDSQVQLLFKILQYLSGNQNPILVEQILYNLYHIKHHDGYGAWFVQHQNLTLDKQFEALGFPFPTHAETSYTELIEKLILDLGLQNNLYLMQFLENAFQEKKYGRLNLADFVKTGLKMEEKWKIDLENKGNAIVLQTIHKSKGLEYPVVIIPFMNSWTASTAKNKHWYPSNIHEEIPEIYTNYSKKILETFPKEMIKEFAQVSAQQKAEDFSDSTNLFYVACTRAKTELYLLNFYTNRTQETDLPQRLLNHFPFSEIENPVVIFGEKHHKKVPEKKANEGETKEINSALNASWSEQILIAEKIGEMPDHFTRFDAQETGNALHDILASIEHRNEVDHALRNYFAHRWVPENIQEEWYAKIKKLLELPEMDAFFDPKNIVYNERDWLDSQGALFRPDRLVKRPNGDYLLLDYKTGKPKVEHEHQVEKYRAILEKSGLRITKSCLIYIEKLVIKTVG